MPSTSSVATTLSALASEPVQTSLWDDATRRSRTPSSAKSADLVLVAPATARLIGAYAAGLSTDLLTNVLLATRAPVIVCPAMHTEMWEHPAVVDNIATLRRRGVHVVEPDEGRLAGGDSARSPGGARANRRRGRARARRRPTSPGCTVVVTAGGTREPIDAVRVIANRSSGKQGYAIAAEALRARCARHAGLDRRPADPPAGVVVDRSRPPPRCRPRSSAWPPTPTSS